MPVSSCGSAASIPPPLGHHDQREQGLAYRVVEVSGETISFIHSCELPPVFLQTDALKGHADMFSQCLDHLDIRPVRIAVMIEPYQKQSK